MELNDLQLTEKGLALIISIGCLFPQPPRNRAQQEPCGPDVRALRAILVNEIFHTIIHFTSV